MPSLHDPAARAALIARVHTLDPARPRQWGRLAFEQMLCHTADQLRMALGEIPADRARGPLRYAPLRYLIIHVLPWPRGRAKGPPEAFTTAATGWEADRDRLLGLIDRFGNTGAADLAAHHPIFGRMTAHDWGVLSYRHLDHHLRQFSA